MLFHPVKVPSIGFALLLDSCSAYCALKGLSDLVDRINAALFPRKKVKGFDFNYFFLPNYYSVCCYYTKFEKPSKLHTKSEKMAIFGGYFDVVFQI